MLKSLVLCVLLWHKVYEINGHADRVSIYKVNQGESTGIQNLQVAVLDDPSLGRANLSRDFNSADEEIVTDYVMAKGIGAFKVHRMKLKWNSARQICNEEGGHLAVLRSKAEVQIVRELIYQTSIFDAWVGFHDRFEEGDWTSVLDEPIREIGGAFWSAFFAENPDNSHNNQDCARVLLYDGGMDDEDCESARPFVCKISLS